MARVALTGSSYISWLQRFCYSDLKVPCETKFFGVSGMRANNIPRRTIDEIKKFKPTLVFILVGGNDIDDQSIPNEISNNICNFVDELKTSGVQFIYVLEILPRGKFKYSKALTIDRYNAQMQKINKKLRLHTNASVVSMKTIKYPADYKEDLVHLCESGQRKLFYIIRKIVLSTRVQKHIADN